MNIETIKEVASEVSSQISSLLEEKGVVAKCNVSYRSADGTISANVDLVPFESFSLTNKKVDWKTIKEGKATIHTIIRFRGGNIGRIVKVDRKKYVVHIENNSSSYMVGDLVKVPFEMAEKF